MCGIAGFYGKGNEQVLWSMVHSLDHRGPDFQNAICLDNIGLAHARLSIIDTDERSNQPFYSSDKRFIITFNGEIYNYKEVRDELLQSKKYTFRTSSDTEVLLYAYAEFGKQCLAKIHGMFAFAIYDTFSKELFLARDRMGKKPLYYTLQNGSFVFASELKAVLKHPEVKKHLNFNTLNDYLTFDYVTSPGSIIQNVKKLEPSSYLIFKEGEITESAEYWQMSFEKSSIPFNTAVVKLDELLDTAVNARLMSDVPLGVFLSGGLDSSAIAYYAQKNSAKKIQTFSIGFNEKSYDESSYAELVAKHLGTEHNPEILSARQTLELFPEVMDKLDEPFADPSILPTYFLSRHTKHKVTVALGGDGSDELMAGYPTFISERVSGAFHSLPKWSIGFFKSLANLLPVSDKNISLDFKLTQFLKGFESSRQNTHSLWLGSFGIAQKRELLTSEAQKQITAISELPRIRECFEQAKTKDAFDKLLYSYYRTYLLDDILFKVDRASMFASLEVRAPFLDTAVVNFLNSLPKSYKISGNNGKRILKEAMRNKLPQAIIDRPKKGFGIPVSLWLRNELKDLTHQLLSEEKLKKQGLFNYQYIKKILEEHHSQKRNHRKLIWNLLVFQIWQEKYLT
jgi:asparagine synthase (glutamine-hydrolysing)